jgi:C4-type Zn-finger protein
VVIYCTLCGFRLFDGVDTGEQRPGELRMSPQSIERLRRSGICSYCEGRLDARDQPET